MAETRRKSSDPVAARRGVFSEYAAELHRYVVRRIRHPEEASDLTQEIFERFLRKRGRVEVIRNPLAYLYGIAAHVLREAYTEHRVSRVAFDSATAEGVSAVQGVDDFAEQADLERDLDEALATLPANYQLALALVMRGWSLDEVAQHAGWTRGTAAVYVCEARAKLKRMLKEYAPRKDSSK